MYTETIISVKWNPNKFLDLKGSLKRSEIAESIGVSEPFYDKLVSGDRKLSMTALAEICVKTNSTPNDFFEIVKKNVK